MVKQYGEMTVAELKALLKERGNPVIGIKSQLVARLEKDDAGVASESGSGSGSAEQKRRKQWDSFFKAVIAKEVAFADLDRLRITSIFMSVLMLLIIFVGFFSYSWYNMEGEWGYGDFVDPNTGEVIIGGSSGKNTLGFGLETLRVTTTEEGAETETTWVKLACEENMQGSSAEAAAEAYEECMAYVNAGKVTKAALMIAIYALLVIIALQVMQGGGWLHLLGTPGAIAFSTVLGSAMGAALGSIMGSTLGISLSVAFGSAAGIGLGVFSSHYRRMETISTAVCTGMVLLGLFLYPIILPELSETMDSGGLGGAWWMMLILSLVYAAVIIAQDEAIVLRQRVAKAAKVLIGRD